MTAPVTAPAPAPMAPPATAPLPPPINAPAPAPTAAPAPAPINAPVPCLVWQLFEAANSNASTDAVPNLLMTFSFFAVSQNPQRVPNLLRELRPAKPVYARGN